MFEPSLFNRWVGSASEIAVSLNLKQGPREMFHTADDPDLWVEKFEGLACCHSLSSEQGVRPTGWAVQLGDGQALNLLGLGMSSIPPHGTSLTEGALPASIPDEPCAQNAPCLTPRVAIPPHRFDKRGAKCMGERLSLVSQISDTMAEPRPSRVRTRRFA
jgi:hypothetical protein